jgi:hypothetical protein
MEQGQPGMQPPPQMQGMGGEGQMEMPMEEVPTGGMPLPSSIPPQVLAAIQSSGADLPNIQ